MKSGPLLCFSSGKVEVIILKVLNTNNTILSATVWQTGFLEHTTWDHLYSMMKKHHPSFGKQDIKRVWHKISCFLYDFF